MNYGTKRNTIMKLGKGQPIGSVWAQRRRVGLALGAVVLGLASSGTVQGAETPAGRAAVRFTATFHQQITITRCAPPLCFGVSRLSARSAAFGVLAGRAATIANVTTMNAGYIATTARVTLTLGNGDHLYMRGVGIERFIPSSNRVSISLAHSVTGGTGRFQGATGLLTEVGTQTLRTRVSGPAETTVSGTLMLPKR